MSQEAVSTEVQAVIEKVIDKMARLTVTDGRVYLGNLP